MSDLCMSLATGNERYLEGSCRTCVFKVSLLAAYLFGNNLKGLYIQVKSANDYKERAALSKI